MMRSPLAHAIRRPDSDGIADLQTDVMRFMAILALCLVAIFALVQSLPMSPVAQTDAAEPNENAPLTPVEAEIDGEPEPERHEPIVLQRPTASRQKTAATEPQPLPLTRPAPVAAEPSPQPAAAAAPPAEAQGFSLRFASDLALTRLVAAGKVGLFAVNDGRARRMSVAESKLSFWDASTPARYHEMDASTVPAAVVDALSRTGTDPDAASWGVTLPGRLSRDLEDIMRGHKGGDLVIGLDGRIRLEGS